MAGRFRGKKGGWGSRSILLAGVLAASACGDGATSPDLGAGFEVVISEPVAVGGGAASTVVGGIARAAPTEDEQLLAYVSIAPGALPSGVTATIADRRTSLSVSTAVRDGGFDPIGIEAAAGDTLDVSITLAGGGIAATRSIVPVSRPPRIVRTVPARGRTDVAINASIAVIFSEPVDETTLDGGSIRLLRDGRAVDAVVHALAGSTVAELVPSDALTPATGYELLVSDRIADLTGDHLRSGATIGFTTAGTGTGAATAGSIVVSIRTVANALAPVPAYAVSVDGAPAQPVSPNGTLTIDNVAQGSHTVSLGGVGASCELTGPATRTVAVDAGRIATTFFQVACLLSPQLSGTIAFVSGRDGNSEIYTVNADGTGLVRLTNDPAADTDPAWSPDGTRIAFASTRDGGTNIYAMNADGSSVTRLTTAGTINNAPAWSPDGRTIAFVSHRNGESGIYLMPVDGERTALARLGYPRGLEGSPAWSPDGNRIAFVSDWRAFDGMRDLYSMRADGGDIVTLFEGPFYWPETPILIFNPAWSPDGRRIAMLACDDLFGPDTCFTSSDIAVVNADGTGLRRIAPAGGWEPWPRPAWSADGTTIIYSSASCASCEPSLRYVTLDGARTGTILANGHSPSWRH